MNDLEKPVNIMEISLLHKCNFNCEHCGYIYVGDDYYHGDKKVAKGHLRELYPDAYMYV